jgi:hypothetical protein
MNSKINKTIIKNRLSMIKFSLFEFFSTSNYSVESLMSKKPTNTKFAEKKQSKCINGMKKKSTLFHKPCCALFHTIFSSSTPMICNAIQINQVHACPDFRATNKKLHSQQTHHALIDISKNKKSVVTHVPRIHGVCFERNVLCHYRSVFRTNER